MLPGGARVLDLGCGAGVPSTHRSPALRRHRCRPLRRASRGGRCRTPTSSTATSRRSRSAIGRLPASPPSTRSRTSRGSTVPALPADRDLAPAGCALLLATLGAGDIPDWTGEWLGAPMFLSGCDTEANRELVRGRGFGSSETRSSRCVSRKARRASSGSSGGGMPIRRSARRRARARSRFRACRRAPGRRRVARPSRPRPRAPSTCRR